MKLLKFVSKKIVEAFQAKVAGEKQKLVHIAEAVSEQGERQFPEKIVHRAIRHIMINIIDRLWQEHLLTMEDLRSDVQMRSVGQRDPLMEYKHEAFSIFNNFIHELHTDTAKDLFKFEITPAASQSVFQETLQQLQMQGPQSFSLETAARGEQQQKPSQPQEQEKTQPIVNAPKVGRNDPCPCGSGKKYKKCCGQNLDI